MTHQKTRGPDDCAGRECETEGTKVTTNCRVEFDSPYNGRPRFRFFETPEESRREVIKLLKRGHHEEDIVEVIQVTNG